MMRQFDLSKLFHLTEVQDNGIGCQPQCTERIFSMFQGLHGKAECFGKGVGLSISKSAENSTAIFGQKANLVRVQHLKYYLGLVRSISPSLQRKHLLRADARSG
jgi:hypothetical protein